MIAPARVAFHLEPQRYTAQIAGPSARVDVIGLLAGDRASVPCVFEDGGWRVDLALPAGIEIVSGREAGTDRGY